MKYTLLVILLASSILQLTWSGAIQPKAANTKKIVCYFGSWGIYRPDAGSYKVKDIPINLCTHIIYGFTGLTNDTLQITGLDPWNDLSPAEGGNYDAFNSFTNLKQQNPLLKALVSIGGWNENPINYSNMAKTATSRQNFISSVIAFLQKYKFDGLDLDWEYPNCRGGVLADRDNFLTLLSELKTAFAPYGYMLTAAVSPGQVNIEAAYSNIPLMASILDQVHLMTYDYHGAWETWTGLNSPLYGNSLYDVANESTLNLDWTVNYYLNHGVPASKMILGMALYGRGFTLDDPTQHGLKAPASNPIVGGPYVQLNGTWGYNEICLAFQSGGWSVVRDSCFQSPYAYKGNQWIGYDDTTSLILKSEYAAAMGLGGAVIWSVDMDDFTGSCSGTKNFLTQTVVNTINGDSNSLPPKCTSSGSTVVAATTTRPTTAVPITTPTSTVLPITSTTTAIPNNPTTTAALSTSNTGATVPPSGLCTAVGIFANPNDCGSFLVCVRNPDGGFTTIVQPCASGTVFSAAITGCTYPQNVPGCQNYGLSTNNGITTPSAGSTVASTLSVVVSTVTPSSAPTTAASLTSTTISSGVCTSIGLQANPNDCCSFFACIHDGQGGLIPILEKCAPGTAFSATIGTCDFPYNVPGCKNTSC